MARLRTFESVVRVANSSKNGHNPRPSDRNTFEKAN